MMNLSIIASIVISISSNIDNIGVGISYGVKGKKFNIPSNITISLVTGVVTYLSMLFGSYIGRLINVEYTDICAGLLLILLGGVSFIDGGITKKLNIDRAIFGSRWSVLTKNDYESDGNYCVGYKETIAIATILSINNIGNGVAAGLAGLNSLVTTVFVMIFSVVSICIGVAMGFRVRLFYMKINYERISGLILVCLGLCEIFPWK